MLWNPCELIETNTCLSRLSLCICILMLVISEQQFAGCLGDCQYQCLFGFLWVSTCSNSSTTKFLPKALASPQPPSEPQSVCWCPEPKCQMSAWEWSEKKHNFSNWALQDQHGWSRLPSLRCTFYGIGVLSLEHFAETCTEHCVFINVYTVYCIWVCWYDRVRVHVHIVWVHVCLCMLAVRIFAGTGVVMCCQMYPMQPIVGQQRRGKAGVLGDEKQWNDDVQVAFWVKSVDAYVRIWKGPI